MGTPSVESLVDRSLSWRLRMPVSQAIAWLQAHHPRGLAQDGSFGPGWGEAIGYSYAGHSSRAWESADLEVEVTQAGGASVLRADAVVVWLDPAPVPDNGSGPRVHLNVTASCPASDKSTGGVTNKGSELRRRLLPAGAPTAGLECRYYGMNGHPWQLRAQTRLTAAAASRLANSIQRVSLSHPVGGITSCPMDDGSAEIIALSYAGRPTVDLWVTLNGCRSIANGFIATSLF